MKRLAAHLLVVLLSSPLWAWPSGRFSVGKLRKTQPNFGYSALPTFILSLEASDSLEVSSYLGAIDAWQRVLDMEGKQTEANRDWLGQVHRNLGIAYRSIGDLDRAVEYFQASLHFHRESAKKQTLQVSLTHYHLGLTHFYDENWKLSRFHMSKARSLSRSVDGWGSYMLGMVRLLDCLEIDKRHCFDAVRKLREALQNKIKEPLYDEVDLSIHLGMALLHAGQEDAARRIHRKALEDYPIKRRLVAERRAQLQYHIALSHLAAGDNESAVKYLKSAIGPQWQRNGRLAYRIKLGEIFERQGLAKQARETYEKTIDILLERRRELGRNYVRRHSRVFERLIALELASGNTEAAFQVEARRRGFSIAEGLSLKDALRQAGIPPQKSRKLKSRRPKRRGMRNKNSSLNDCESWKTGGNSWNSSWFGSIHFSNSIASPASPKRNKSVIRWSAASCWSCFRQQTGECWPGFQAGNAACVSSSCPSLHERSRRKWPPCVSF